MATFGICAANYNYARFLPAFFEGLVSQTRPLDEIVIVDDGSTDGSVEIIESYRSRFRRFVFIRNEKNLGGIASYNLALSRITTDYTSSAAIDDRIFPRFLEVLGRLLERFPKADIAACSTVFWNEDNDSRWIGGDLLAERESFVTPEEIVAADLRDRFGMFGNTVVVRTERFRSLGGYDADLVHMSDTFVWMALALSKGMAYTPEPLAHCRIATTSYSGRSVRRWKTKSRAIEAFLEKCLREAHPGMTEGLRRSGYLVNAGIASLPVIASHPAYWRFLSIPFLRRYLTWNWWRLCDRHLPAFLSHRLRPRIPILERPPLSASLPQP